MTLHHHHLIEFRNHLHVSVSVKEDEVVAQLKKELADALSGATVSPEVQAKIDQIFVGIKSNTAKVAQAAEDNTPKVATEVNKQ